MLTVAQLLPELEVGGVEQGLGRHASAEDAQSAELGGPVDDGDLPAAGGEGAGGGESSGTAADDGSVKVHGGHAANFGVACLAGNPRVVTV